MHPDNRVLKRLASCFLVILFLLASPAAANAEKTRPAFFSQFDQVLIPEKPTYFPALTYRDPAGRSVTLKVGRGEYVLLNVWATWCPPCLIELPTLERLRQHIEASGRGRVIPVSVDTKFDHFGLKNFIEERGLPLAALNMDTHGTIMRQVPVRGLPTSFLLGEDRQILYLFEGDALWTSQEAAEFFNNLP